MPSAVPVLQSEPPEIPRVVLVSADGSETAWSAAEAAASSLVISDAIWVAGEDDAPTCTRIPVPGVESARILEIALRVASSPSQPDRESAVAALDDDALAAFAHAANFLNAPLALDAAVGEVARRLRGRDRSAVRSALGVDGAEIGAAAAAPDTEWID